MSYVVSLIPGDGIGPEVTSATKRVIEATGVGIEWVSLPIGAAGNQDPLWKCRLGHHS